MKDEDRYERCKTIVAKAEILVNRDLSSLWRPTSARTRAAMLCLAYVMSLEKIFKSNLHPFTHAANDMFGNSAKGFCEPLMLRDPLKTWFSSPLRLTSRMEKYVYNVSRYLQLRFCFVFSERYAAVDIGIIPMTFKYICGLSEEYRRSAWY